MWYQRNFRPGDALEAAGRTRARLTTRAYSDFDVSKGVLAFARRRVLERGDLSDGVPSSGVNEIRLLRFGHRRSRRVASARYTSNPRYQAFGGVFLNDVTLDEGHVYWVSTDQADLRSEKTVDLKRAPVYGSAATTTLSGAGRQPPYGAGGGFPASSYAVDGDDIYYYSVPFTTRGAITHVTPVPPVFD